MYRNKKVILTICARGGSRGFPKKNIYPLFRKPLITYTINQAKKLPWIDKIVVSTDDIRIRNIALNNGVMAPFLRPKKLSLDKSPKIPAIIHAIDKAEKIWHENYDINIDLSVTSPIRKPIDVKKCVDLLFIPKTKTVFSVSVSKDNPYFNMVRLNKQKFAELFANQKKKIERRQDSPPVYSLNGSIYVAWINVLRNEKTYYTDKTRIYIMSPEKSVDIDSKIDIDFLRFLIQKKRVSL